MLILVVNAGSSSLKLRLLDGADQIVQSDDVETDEGVVDDAKIEAAVASWGTVGAVGHRIVHGGVRFTRPVLVDANVRSELESLSDLAPLHQPKSLAALDAVTKLFPDVPAVASFDTAFHATMPPAAVTYALPSEWRKRWGLRRYGFHGLSHAYAARRASELVGQEPANLNLVICHLGAGASLAAVEGGRSVDTTMGFTPLEGLVMATRSGSLDPGLMLWLEEHAHMPPGALADTLEHRSGLFGLSGSADMRVVLGRAPEGDAAAQLALDVYVHRLRSGIASMAASMGGLDALVFTGGVGERAAPVRAMAIKGLGFLGINLDLTANDAAETDCEIGTSGAVVRTLVIHAQRPADRKQRGARQVLSMRN